MVFHINIVITINKHYCMHHLFILNHILTNSHCNMPLIFQINCFLSVAPTKVMCLFVQISHLYYRIYLRNHTSNYRFCQSNENTTRIVKHYVYKMSSTWTRQLIFVPTFSLSESINFTIFFSFPYNVQTCHRCNRYSIVPILYVNQYLCWLIAVHITGLWVPDWVISTYVFKDGCKTSHHRMKYIRSWCIVNTIIGTPACICMNHECISIVHGYRSWL
jgi:hypothetical protein